MKRKSSWMIRLICLILILSATMLPAASLTVETDKTDSGTHYPFIFVSGFAGWGQYDMLNDALPYWGRLNGDLMATLNSQGYECYAASVDAWDSAWDRACELYAQLTGSVVDYGAAHSARYRHWRYGADYSKSPLINAWGAEDSQGNTRKINLVGHSFGGATVRLFADLLAYGDEMELAETPADEISGLFTGGKADLVHSITTLASPHNGTTLTLLIDPSNLVNFPINGEPGREVIRESAIFETIYGVNKLIFGTREADTGVYDLTIDGAAALNETIDTLPGVYYFSYPTDSTTPAFFTDRRMPDIRLTDPVLWIPTYYMGSTSSVTLEGSNIDNTWYSNDGVVNTVSTTAPRGTPQQAYNPVDIPKGVWNVMPTFMGDHAAIIGGLSYTVDINDFYLQHLRLIDSLE